MSRTCRRETRPLVWTVAACLTVSLSAQPSADPELQDESVGELGSRLRDGGGTPPGVEPAEPARAMPVRSHTPSQNLGIDDDGRPLTEGSFLVAARGLIARAPSGAWIFSPAHEPDEERLRPMIILPSQLLARLAQLVGDTDAADNLEISGRVTLYRGRNYLLLTAINQQNELAEHDESAADAQRADETVPGIDEATQRLIDELEAARTGVRGVIASSSQSDTEAQSVIAEGRTIVRRRARLLRLSAGELAVSFDNDSDQPDATVDQPLVIAPCAALESIEDLIETHGEASPVTVSGVTLAYGGRSYILPSGISIEPPTELSSRQ
ncbi:MAG: hypothetical protein ACTS22_03715 [Phycisphaerales bacterium]